MAQTEYRSPWDPGWREEAWEQVGQEWDIIIVGGAITGMGILALTARAGLRVLLLDQGDFASGTSSRSSKLVHGGLRYLTHLELKLARGSVHERQALLSAGPGLVDPLGFIYPVYRGEPIGPRLVEAGLTLYTHMAKESGDYRRLEAVDIIMLAPGLIREGLAKGYAYRDAQTDDARLVLRVCHDALLRGEGRAKAINYARVIELIRKAGRVAGVVVRDEETGRTHEAVGRAIVNAAGVWSDQLTAMTGAPKRLRPLRGSHLYFEHRRFPIYQAIAFCHPDDDRPVFATPWQGVTLVGTTDVDHDASLSEEPHISRDEADYLLHGIQTRFPDLRLAMEDILNVQSGIRPVIASGKARPSDESRDHAIWADQGLLTVTGGKLTTFRLVALDALKAVHEMAPDLPSRYENVSVLDPPGDLQEMPDPLAPHWTRWKGRYGAAALEMARDASTWESIQGTPYLLAELLGSAGREAVCHLDDLFLRRFRFGLLLPDAGQSLMTQLAPQVQKRLGWDDGTWTREVSRYRAAHGVRPPVPWVSRG